MQMNKNKNLRNIFFTSIFALSLISFFGLSGVVNSGASDNMSGFAWGADDTAGDPSGMGWLSFNSINDHDPNAGGVQPSAQNYGVTVDNNKNIVGYAWSSNYGWIKFGGLSGFPSGPGTTFSNAKIVNGSVVGWARVCSVLANTDCTLNALKPSTSTGGWDGWISLNGTGYDVTLNETTGAFSGFAWGGPDVLGWVNFSQVLKDAPIVPPPGGAILNFSTDSYTVYPPNYQTTLRWSSDTSLTECVASNNGSPVTSSWSGSVANPNSSKLVSVPENPTPVKYDLRCFDGSVFINAKSVSLTRGSLPEDVLFKNTKPVLNNGVYTTKLSWTTKNIVPGSCVASGGWSGTKTTTPTGSQDGAGSESGIVVPAIYPATTRYTFTCTGFYSGRSEVRNLDLNEKSKDEASSRTPIYEEE